MPNIKDKNDFLNHLGGIVEAFMQAYVAETQTDPKWVDVVGEPGTGDVLQTIRITKKAFI